MLSNTISLRNEKGKSVSYEFLDMFQYNQEKYIVVLPVESFPNERGLEIFRYDNHENEAYQLLNSDEAFSEIFLLFYNRFMNESLYVDNKEKIYSLFKRNSFLRSLIEEREFENLNPEDVRKGLSELYRILECCSSSVRECIPQKFIEFLQNHMDAQWERDLDFTLNLNDMNLLPETRAWIYLVYRDFLCTEEEKREPIKKEKHTPKLFGCCKNIWDVL